MRAVPLDAGEHIVEMRYESRYLRIGGYLCLVSCVFVALTVMICLRGWPILRKRGSDA
jgi:hypothetical protein